MAEVRVFLHGLMALYEKPDEILALLVDVPSTHVFRAGDWCAESTLRSGAYRLTGVKPGDGTAHLKPENNVHLGEIPFPWALFRAAQSVISFPRPKEIRSLRKIPVVPSSDFKGSDQGRSASVSNMATVQLLTFDTDDITRVLLGDHDWRPPASHDEEFVNLHIYAEEDTIRDGAPQHAVDSFAQIMQQFAQLDIQLTEPKNIPEFDATEEKLPSDVHPSETDDLSSRQNRLARLGKKIREKSHGSAVVNQVFNPAVGISGIASKMGACSFVVAKGA